MDNAKTVAKLRADLAVATAEHADATARVTQALARMESLEMAIANHAVSACNDLNDDRIMCVCLTIQPNYASSRNVNRTADENIS